MKIRYLNVKMVIFWLGIILFHTTAWGQISTEIHQANQLYTQGQFSEAAEIYERVIAEGMENGHLHYNLGNAYFRLGNLSKAILHYTKAQNLLPRNEDIEANLKYALRQTEDQRDAQIPQSAVLSWTRDFNLNEHGKALFWINLLFWASMVAWLRFQIPAIQLTRKILLAFLIVALISTGFRWHEDNSRTLGVILPQQANVHSRWSTDTVVLYQLHRGTVVSISQEKENWYEIELPDAKKGWILKSNITK